jgi:hypothetical protein
MRCFAFIAPLLSFALSSCSITVSLVFVNRTDMPVSIDTHKAVARLWPDTEQKFQEWPDGGRLVSIKTDRCIRTFNLDENYSPANEWRLSTFEIVRRYAVHGDGRLRIEMPDKAHLLSQQLAAQAPHPAHLELTPVTEQCSR